MIKTSTQQAFKASNGQALIEFVIALPLLIILMASTFAIGVAMYSGANASTAVRTVKENRAALADSVGGANDLMGFINAYNSGSLAVAGNVDSVNTVQNGKVISTIAAQKAVTPPPIPFITLPTFTFTSVDGIHSSLLQANTGASVGLNDVPYDVANASIAGTINPADYDITDGVPIAVPIDANCNADMTVFSDQKNANITFSQDCMDVVGCTLTRSIELVNAHLAAFDAYACNEPNQDTNDVTFVDDNNY